MRGDLQPVDIESVFCWRTNTGQVQPGARDARYNGRPVRYQPGNRDSGEGLRTIVLGHEVNSPPTGFRLVDQGTVSRMGCFVSGFVTHAHLVPARDASTLHILRALASQGIASGTVREWALARIQGGGRRIWAVHLGGAEDVFAGVAAEVKAPWTLTVDERPGQGWPKGTEIVARDPSGAVLATLEADTRFSVQPVPRLYRGKLS